MPSRAAPKLDVLSFWGINATLAKDEAHPGFRTVSVTVPITIEIPGRTADMSGAGAVSLPNPNTATTGALDLSS
jgi:hypothetical protein